MERKYKREDKNKRFDGLNKREKLLIKNFKGLNENLQRQKEISELYKDEDFDFETKPSIIINMLEKQFMNEENEKEKLRGKTKKHFKSLLKFDDNKLYGKKTNSTDYEELKKRNKLTEYICLMKAKNHFELHNLEKEFNLYKE